MNDYELNEVSAVARAATMQTLAQAVAANEGRLKVISEMGPAFKEFYGSDSYTNVLADHPKLAEAILMAEATPSVQDSHLGDFYSTVWDCAIAKGLPSQGQKHPTTSPSPLRRETTSAALTEEQIFRSTEESKRADLSSKNRRALIEQLESSGAADIEF